MKLKRKPEFIDWLNITVILILLGLFIWISVNYTRVFGKINTGDLVSSAENLRQFILSYGNSSVLVMTALHTLQVVISFIPSVGVQFIGGLIFGMRLGMITGLIGISIGTFISFYLSRILGKRAISLFVSEANIKKVEGLIESDTSTIILLLLYILPTPKDFFAYFVGITKMKASKLFLISAIGRLPGMLVANYLGAHIYDRNYILLASVTIVSSALGLLLYVYKDKLLTLASHIRKDKP